jgi:hypothetical protein
MKSVHIKISKIEVMSNSVKGIMLIKEKPSIFILIEFYGSAQGMYI